ncbi:hypothetical protein GP486_001182 [Trichoglossum hirsutum]|uniref:Transcription factor IIIC putative zinc-finger domain-containing protein n=1 Tax=Trichoglossum hirsutum TaxID=265104 RepID=A0A9P8LHM9_9PEZI|nr:hypothetical protein GP486_001182 [Trichoglossum hirsutum]
MRPRISKYCGVCGKEYLSEDINQLEEQNTLGKGEGNGQNKIANTRGLAQALLEAAMEVETEERAPLSLEGDGAPDAAIERESASKMERQISLASLLFAACDVCVYCGGKFCRDGTI